MKIVLALEGLMINANSMEQILRYKNSLQVFSLAVQVYSIETVLIIVCFLLTLILKQGFIGHR